MGHVDTTVLESLVGERTVPGLWHENYWFRRHEIAYLDLAGPVRDALTRTGLPLVVEAGCGEGYGLRLLHDAGIQRLVGLDYDAAAMAHAHRQYPEAGVARAGLSAIPLADGCAGAIISLQVIEHLWTPWEFTSECARLLAPGGLLAISTPNRVTFSPGLGRNEKPPNPYHVREFDAGELFDTIDPHVPVTAMLAVAHGPRLAAWEAEHGSMVAAQLATPPPQWDDALAELVTSITAADFILRPIDSLDDAAVLDLVVLAEPLPGANVHDHRKVVLGDHARLRPAEAPA